MVLDEICGMLDSYKGRDKVGLTDFGKNSPYERLYPKISLFWRAFYWLCFTDTDVPLHQSFVISKATFDFIIFILLFFFILYSFYFEFSIF